MENKTCSRCNTNKPILEFYNKKTSKDGKASHCIICDKLVTNNYCKNNIIKEKDRHIKYYIINKTKILWKNKEWRESNPDKVKEINDIYIKNNPHIRAWRDVLGNCLKRLDQNKNDKTIVMLGYSALELKQHLESLFTEAMSWANYGEWHIDHIKEVRSFDKNTPPNIVNSLSNLRPLWATTREINGVYYEGNLNRKRVNI